MTAPFDPTSIDFDSLSIDQIDTMIAELETSIQEEGKNMTIPEIVEHRVSTEWDTVEKNLREEFQDSIKNERESFILKESIRIVVKNAMGEDLAKEFMKTLNSCIRKNSFMTSQSFYQRTKSQSIRDVARLAFFVYRHQNAISDKNGIREARKLMQSNTTIVQTAVQDFQNLNLLSI